MIISGRPTGGAVILLTSPCSSEGRRYDFFAKIDHFDEVCAKNPDRNVRGWRRHRVVKGAMGVGCGVSSCTPVVEVAASALVASCTDEPLGA